MTRATRKVSLADVLWDAANNKLASSLFEAGDSEFFTCCAVSEWIKEIMIRADRIAEPEKYEAEWDGCRIVRKQAENFLFSLGCPINSLSQFRAFKDEERQGVRYMWLLLAMHVAEDEGIEIEVQS